MEGWTLQQRPKGPATLNAHLSTGQLADALACSAQHLRNLERDGVIPPSTRSGNGYRWFHTGHLHAAKAYQALSTALGPVAAKRLMRELQADPTAIPARLDEVHAALHAERAALRRAVAAAGAISAEVIGVPHADDAMTIGQLAAALDLRTSTLRHWESEGLLAPDRHGSARSYSPAEVQQARIVDQLRRAGYRIPELRSILAELRGTGRNADVRVLLDRRGQALDDRSRALLRAGTHLLQLAQHEQ